MWKEYSNNNVIAFCVIAPARRTGGRRSSRDDEAIPDFNALMHGIASPRCESGFAMTRLLHPE